jgi:hypothetical protein
VREQLRRWPVRIALAVTGVGVIVIGAYYAYTPTTRVTVFNDSSVAVELTNCGDPAEIKPGESSAVEIDKHDSTTTCDVINYFHDTPTSWGCLVLHPLEPPVRLNKTVTHC